MKSEFKTETWETPRRCPKCLDNKKTVHMRAQYWDNGSYRISCPYCKEFQVTTWDGRSGFDGQGVT